MIFKARANRRSGRALRTTMTVFAAMGVLITSVTVIACGLPTQAEVTVAGIHSLDWKQQFEAEGWI